MIRCTAPRAAIPDGGMGSVIRRCIAPRTVALKAAARAPACGVADPGVMILKPAALKSVVLGALALLALAGPGLAQETGGLRISPAAGTGPVGLAQPLPFTYQPLVTARDLQAGPTAAERRERHQGLISKLRGDPGYLAGFSFGTPLAPSRQVPVAADEGFGFGFEEGFGPGGGRGRRPIVINNNGPVAVAVGNDNVIQQQTAISPGPIAQQQVATVNRGADGSAGGAKSGGIPVIGGGAVNIVTGNGNIIQRAPGQ
jgi:hypothetical protein